MVCRQRALHAARIVTDMPNTAVENREQFYLKIEKEKLAQQA